MARTRRSALRRRAAFVALFRALRSARGGPPLLTRLAAVPRMIMATVRGEYDARGRLSLMALATVYVASPLSLIPDAFFLLFGLIDEAFVATWLAGAVLSETERFLAWETERRRIGAVAPA